MELAKNAIWVSLLFSHHSLPLLAALLRPLPLRIDLRRERILKAQCDLVDNQHESAENKPSRLSIPQRGAHEAHEASIVHWRPGNVEREARHDVVHQDAKVIAEICARDPQRPHAAQDEDIATGDEADCQALRYESLEQWMRDLSAECALVECIPEETDGEDDDG